MFRYREHEHEHKPEGDMILDIRLLRYFINPVVAQVGIHIGLYVGDI
jgi:hypothetical protein